MSRNSIVLRSHVAFASVRCTDVLRLVAGDLHLNSIGVIVTVGRVRARLDGDDVLLVRQYRLSLRRETLEIPAGKLEKGEDPLSCAKRELSEEAGLEAVRIEKILSVNPSPGYTDETIHIYYCGEYVKSASHLDEGEFLNLVRINKQRCFEMVESGEIADAKTVAALLWLKSRLLSSS